MNNLSYNKGNSINDIDSSVNQNFKFKLKSLINNFDSLNLTETKKQIFKKYLLNNDNLYSSLFKQHVKDEISKLENDLDFLEYLYHRLRYDFYPSEKLLDDYPPCVQIEPTSICNLRCIFCFQTDLNSIGKSEGHMGQMKLELFKKIIDEIEGNVQFVTLASRGEPLLAKNIIEMLEYTKNKFLGLKINTNATFMNEDKIHAILESNVNTVVFSADSYKKEEYESLRVRGNFEKVVENITNFNDIRQKYYPKSKVITRVSGVKYDSSKQNFINLKNFWSKLVDQVVFVDYNPWENCYSKTNNNINDPCSDLWRRTFIWWDGKVNPCDVDYRSWLSTGNILTHDLKSIWKGSAYNLLRENHLKSLRQSVRPCSSCVSV